MPTLDRSLEDWWRSAALILFVILSVIAVILLFGFLTTRDATLGSIAAVLISGAALLFNAWQFTAKAEIDRSRFALDMAMDGVQRAHGILVAAEPARRLEWVNAGRVLLRAMEMSSAIRAKDHKLAWELFREEWRIKFYYFTRRSPEYYFGLPEPADYAQQKVKSYPDEKIIALLKQTSDETEFNMTRMHSSSSQNTYLPDAAIKAVYDFAEYEEGWSDPLDGVEGFTDEQVQRVRHRNTEGLYVFLYAIKKWLVLGDSIREWDDMKDEADADDAEVVGVTRFTETPDKTG